MNVFFESLTKKGSNSKLLQKLKPRLKNYELYLDENNISKTLKSLENELQNLEKDYLSFKTKSNHPMISCLATSIKYKSHEILSYKGTISRANSEKIDEKTVFDIASITKLFTALLVLKLEEYGYYKLTDKITKHLPELKGLKDITILDLMLMNNKIITKHHLGKAKNKTEVLKILKNIELVKKYKNKNQYTDIGLIVISRLIEEVVSKKMNKSMKYYQIMDIHILKKYKLNSTTFFPKENITGNDIFKKRVHDPKARLLNGSAGSAGLFTNINDINILVDNIFECFRKENYVFEEDLISKKNVQLLGTKQFFKGKDRNKGFSGIYQKDQKGLKKTYISNLLAKGSFAAHGYTGPLMIVDPSNELSISIFINVIDSELFKKNQLKNGKPIYHAKRNKKYIKEVTELAVILKYIIEKHLKKL